MYKLKDIRDVHLEVTSRCQAKCPMCPRRINGGILNPLINEAEINLETFKKWFSNDFIKQLDTLFMCGNLGDPIVAGETLEIFEHIRQVNPNINLSMHTNGSARNNDWWIKLSKLNVRVVFGIDGLDDTHELYRVSTNWKSIIENARSFIDSGGHAEWHMIVFKHNEHQIEECKKLSEELGFKHFQVKHTTRFDNEKFHVLNNQGKTVNILYPSQQSKEMIKRVVRYTSDVNPEIKCKAKNQKQFYISADGHISPCCWLDFSWILPKKDTRIDYMDKIGQLPNLHTASLKDIFDSGHFDRIAATWSDNPLSECSKQCGNFDKCGAQFVQH